MTRHRLYRDDTLVYDYTEGVAPGETCGQFIARMYATYLPTVNDPAGVAWWTEQCRDGAQSRAQIEDAFKAAAAPPVIPPITPPSGDPSDISDQAMHQFIANEGQAFRFFWRQSFTSAEQLTVIQVAAAAHTGHWSIDGGPWQSFTPSGSDFRFIPIENAQVQAGTHTIDVKITGISGGTGRFGIQNVGAGVGP